MNKMRPIENYYETVTSFNFITKYLHRTKYNRLKIILSKNSKKLNIIDIGCGTCNVFKELRNDFKLNYIGLDEDEMAIKISNSRYKNFKNFQSFCSSVNKFNLSKFLSKNYSNNYICFDTIEHMSFEDFQTMVYNLLKTDVDNLFINIPVENGLSLLIKNLGSILIGYRRHKEYTFIQTILATFSLFKYLPNHKKKHLGFQWKKIYNYLKTNYNIKSYTSPIKYVPIFISPNIFMECKKKY